MRPSYIHEFGYCLANKILGADGVNKCVRDAYRLQQQEEELSVRFHSYRANWRSNGVRFPWQLPKSSDVSVGGGSIGDEKESITPETLLVDITFDFVLFPVEIVQEGRTRCCHIVKVDNDGGEGMIEEEADSIAIAVAIRLGALVAIPNSQCSDIASSGDKNMGNNDVKGDGYQYYYLRGDNALSVSDLDEHCRGVDIVLEEMEAANVAGFVGDAFLDKSGGGESLQVTAKLVNGRNTTAIDTFSNTLTTIDSVAEQQTTNNIAWHLKVHHAALEADGFFPVGNNNRGDNLTESIARRMLDMVLLQSNASPTCISLPATEARMLWNTIDTTFVRALDKPVAPSPQKKSPARASRPNAAAADENKAKADKSSKPKTAAYKPQETAIFARGSRTTLSRKRKPKFTLGPG